MEDTVDTFVESEQDDAALAPEENGTIALTELLGEAEEADEAQDPAEAEQTEEQEQETEEHHEPEKVSGGIKGRLLAENKKGYEAGRQAAYTSFQEEKARMQAEIDRLRTYELKEQAASIAKEQGVSEEVAMFLAQNGFKSKARQEAIPAPEQRPRDEQGRFVSTKQQETENPMAARAAFLEEQARTIKSLTGQDCMKLFDEADASTKAKIANGQMDFADLAKAASEPPKRTPPAVKPTGSGIPTGKSFSNMTDDEFDRVEKFLRKGGSIDTRR